MENGEEGIFLFAKSSLRIRLTDEEGTAASGKLPKLRRKKIIENVYKKYPIQIITYEAILREQLHMETVASLPYIAPSNGIQVRRKGRKRMNRTRRVRRERKLNKMPKL